MGVLRPVRTYGWRPDKPNPKDDYIRRRLVAPSQLPRQVDLSSGFPECYDQGALGSCTGNAIAGAIQYTRRQEKLIDFVPSRLFIYYNERVIEGTVQSDAGAEIRDGIQTVMQQGACSEADWPYDESAFREQPPSACYNGAALDLITDAKRVEQNHDSVCGCLAAKIPVIFGFTVFESFESSAVAKTGNMPMPGPSESPIGGHAVVAVGYDDDQRVFKVRNSWGSYWGQSGYFYMSYNYLLDNSLADDLWQIDATSTRTGLMD